MSAQIMNLIETQAPSNLVVIAKSNTMVVSAPGPVGATGPQGPQGPAGNNGASRFADLEDVLLVNLGDDNLIKWNSALQSFVNRNSVDGGSF